MTFNQRINEIKEELRDDGCIGTLDGYWLIEKLKEALEVVKFYSQPHYVTVHVGHETNDIANENGDKARAFLNGLEE